MNDTLYGFKRRGLKQVETLDDIEGGFYYIDPNQFEEVVGEGCFETKEDAMKEATRLAALCGHEVKVEVLTERVFASTVEERASLGFTTSVERQCMDLAMENEETVRKIARDLRIIAGLL